MSLPVISMKLSTGEEIIGKVVEQLSDEDFMVLEDARLVVVYPNGELKLAPVLFSANYDKNITVFKNSVVLISQFLRPEFEQGYLESVSKLALPTKKIILE